MPARGARRPEDWMQSVAAEMNLSETAFVASHRRRPVRAAVVHADRRGRPVRPRDARDRARALGTGRAGRRRVLGSRPAAACCRATRRRRADRARLPDPARRPGRARGRAARRRWAASHPRRPHAGGGRRLVVELGDATAVRGVDARLPGPRPPTAIVVHHEPRRRPRATTSCRACFGPAHGIDEDPVTGSAHCVLSPYWAARLGRDRARRLPGVAARRRGARPPRRRPRPPRRPRRHRPRGELIA